MLTIVLLTISNVLMTIAWYGHLRHREVPLFKTIQEIITLVVFSAFSILYLKEGIRWNHAAGFVWIVAASALTFRK